MISVCTAYQMAKSRPVEKAWQLLALCLTIFPPSKGFEGYLEAWIRRYAVVLLCVWGTHECDEAMPSCVRLPTHRVFFTVAFRALCSF